MIYLKNIKEMFLGSRLAVYAFAFRIGEGWHIKKSTTFRLLVGVTRCVPRICHCQVILDYLVHSERAGWHITQAPKRVGMDLDVIKGEVPPEVTNICLSFAGLPQEEIVRIFHNRFKAINLYRLQHMRELRYEAFQDQERISIENRMLNIQRIWKELPRGLEDGIYQLHRHPGIAVRQRSPSLHTVLTQFYGNILQLSKAYEWQEAVLPMAIEVHTHIMVMKSPSRSGRILKKAYLLFPM